MTGKKKLRGAPNHYLPTTRQFKLDMSGTRGSFAGVLVPRELPGVADAERLRAAAEYLRGLGLAMTREPVADDPETEKRARAEIDRRAARDRSQDTETAAHIQKRREEIAQIRRRIAS